MMIKERMNYDDEDEDENITIDLVEVIIIIDHDIRMCAFT